MAMSRILEEGRMLRHPDGGGRRGWRGESHPGAAGERRAGEVEQPRAGAVAAEAVEMLSAGGVERALAVFEPAGAMHRLRRLEHEAGEQPAAGAVADPEAALPRLGRNGPASEIEIAESVLERLVIVEDHGAATDGCGQHREIAHGYLVRPNRAADREAERTEHLGWVAPARGLEGDAAQPALGDIARAHRSIDLVPGLRLERRRDRPGGAGRRLRADGEGRGAEAGLVDCRHEAGV